MVLDVNSLESESGRQLSELLSPSGFDPMRNSNVIFRFRVEKAQGDLATVNGILEFHGEQFPIVFSANLTSEGGSLRLTGSFDQELPKPLLDRAPAMQSWFGDTVSWDLDVIGFSLDSVDGETRVDAPSSRAYEKTSEKPKGWEIRPETRTVRKPVRVTRPSSAAQPPVGSSSSNRELVQPRQ